MQQEIIFGRKPYEGRRKLQVLPPSKGRRTKDINGQTFGQLTALRVVGSGANGGAVWLCSCACGQETKAEGAALRALRKTSCGCAWRTTFEKSRICGRCKIEKPHTDFDAGHQGNILHAYCKECRRKESAARYHKNPQPYMDRAKAANDAIRARVLKAYGGACVCCGEVEPIFLALDHKEGGGSKHRRSLGSQGKGTKFYNWVIEQAFPTSLQLLCANCNWGKYVNGGVCPHVIHG